MVWVAISSLRRSTRSAIAPPHGPSRSDGRPPAASTRPSEVAEPVSWKTSQPMAVCCKNVPLAETTCPAKNRRNGRDFRARKDPFPTPRRGDRSLRRRFGHGREGITIHIRSGGRGRRSQSDGALLDAHSAVRGHAGGLVGEVELPLGYVTDWVRRSAVGTVPSANTCLPLPSSNGYTHRFIRSTRPKRSRDCKRSRLPMTWTSSWRPLRAVMLSARSPATSVDPCQASGPASVRLATYLGTPLSSEVKGSPEMRSASSWQRSRRFFAQGAGRPCCWLARNMTSPDSWSATGACHPPCAKPPSWSSSGPPGLVPLRRVSRTRSR